MVVLGIWVDLAALLVIAFLVPTNDNTALIGGAFVLFYLYQQFGSEIGLNIEALFD